MSNRQLLSFVVVIGLLLGACGSSGDSSPTVPPTQATDGAGETTTSTTVGESLGDSQPSGDLPPSASSDFTVPIPSGWEVDILDDIGMTEATGAQLLYGQDSFADVVSFYDEWTTSQPDEYTRTDIDGVVVYQRLDSPPVIITVTPDYEERGGVYTHLLIAGGTDA